MTVQTIVTAITNNTQLQNKIAENYANDLTIVGWAKDPSKWKICLRTDSGWIKFIEKYVCWPGEDDHFDEDYYAYALAILNPGFYDGHTAPTTELDDYSGAQLVIYDENGVRKIETHQGEIYIL